MERKLPKKFTELYNLLRAFQTVAEDPYNLVKHIEARMTIKNTNLSDHYDRNKNIDRLFALAKNKNTWETRTYYPKASLAECQGGYAWQNYPMNSNTVPVWNVTERMRRTIPFEKFSHG